MTRTPARSPHALSCSIAAARNVSAAAMMTFLPSALNCEASLPQVVVFPLPLTPIMMTTDGLRSTSSGRPMPGTASRRAISSSAKAFFSSRLLLILLSIITRRSSVISSSVVSIPTSPSMSCSSSSSQKPSSTGSSEKRLETLCVHLFPAFFSFSAKFLKKLNVSSSLCKSGSFAARYSALFLAPEGRLRRGAWRLGRSPPFLSLS